MKALKIEKPTTKEALVIMLGLLVIMILYDDLGLLNLFSNNSGRGFFYDYQVIIGGLLAFGAGFFVWISNRETISFQKNKRIEEIKNGRNFYYVECIRYTDILDRYVKALTNKNSDNKRFKYLLKDFPNDFLSQKSDISFFSTDELILIAHIKSSLTHMNSYIALIRDAMEKPGLSVYELAKESGAIEIFKNPAISFSKLSLELEKISKTNK